MNCENTQPGGRRERYPRGPHKFTRNVEPHVAQALLAARSLGSQVQPAEAGHKRLPSNVRSLPADSGRHVRHQLAFEHRDVVFQQKLAPFQAFELKLVLDGILC